MPYPLLSDTGLEVVKSYDVLNPRGTGPRRTLFVVGRDGILRWKNEAFKAGDPDQFQELLDAVAAARR